MHCICILRHPIVFEAILMKILQRNREVNYEGNFCIKQDPIGVTGRKAHTDLTC